MAIQALNDGIINTDLLSRINGEIESVDVKVSSIGSDISSEKDFVKK